MLQNTLGYGALREGLTFVATAAGFGAVGLTWRKRRPGLQGSLIPGGFVMTALSYALLGTTLHGGGDGGIALHVAFAGVGVGPVPGFAPTLAGAPSTVRHEGAADAVWMTVLVRAGTAIRGALAGSGRRSLK